ncbi:hypothetical protein V6N13_071928 [Hibiscus sabdariffa]
MVKILTYDLLLIGEPLVQIDKNPSLMEDPSLEPNGIPPERPLEALVQINVMLVREQHRSPVVVDYQNMAKKAKGDDERLEVKETNLLGRRTRLMLVALVPSLSRVMVAEREP